MTEDFKKKLPYLVDRIVELKENSQRYCEIIQRLKSLIKEEKKQGHIIVRMDDLENILFELCEPEDERIRKEIIYHIQHCDDTIDEATEKRMVAWLEKQKGVTNREYVFRPTAGSEISDAAKKAVKKQKSGENIVLAFNGVYIAVDGKSPDEIVNEYCDAIIEKQMNQFWKNKIYGDYPESMFSDDQESKITKTDDQIPTDE